MRAPDHFNQIGVDHLPGYPGIVITHVGPREIRAELPVKPSSIGLNCGCEASNSNRATTCANLKLSA